jgi:DNA (cytosine-5)-methyltransferase 1
MKRLKMISLFSGIGGFELAAQWTGIKTIESVEINPYCQKVLKKNFPNTPIQNDVTVYHPKPNKAQIVCGGSPCQDMSIAGKQKGIIEGKRSSLWFEQLRIYQESGATFLIWENVLGSLRNGFREVLRSLSESGYDAEWQTISAAALRAPHLRERIFLIAYPSSLQLSAEPQTWADQIRRQAAIASTYPNSTSSQGNRRAERSVKESADIASHSRLSPWSSIKPSFRVLDDGISEELGRYYEMSEMPECGVSAGLQNRLDQLSALGNAIVPQCAVIPLLRVKYLAELIA